MTEIGMSDVLNLSDSEQTLIRWMMRQKSVSLAEAVAYMNQGEDVIFAMLNSLIEQGFVQPEKLPDELRYRTCIAQKKSPKLSQNIWDNLDEDE